MSTKTCKKCGKEKPATDFTPRHKTCKECIFGPYKPDKKSPNKYDTPKKVQEYVNYMTNDLTGNDY